MSKDELEALIVEELTLELNNEVGFNADILSLKVRNAYREIKQTRNYPKTYSESMIDDDMENYYTHIKALALYDYAKIGAEGQDNYSADGENIQYTDRNKMFSGVLPLARV